MSDKDYAELVATLATLEESMETKQAQYRSDIAALAKVQQAKRGVAMTTSGLDRRRDMNRLAGR